MPARTLISILRPVSQLKLYRKGTSVLLQGELPRTTSVIVDGVVRAYVITPEGEERVVALYGPGDIFPFAWTYGHSSSSLYYYNALSDVRLLAIDRSVFLQTIAASPAATQALTHLLSKNYVALLMRITGLVQSRAVEKIAYTFYYFLFRYGVEREPHIYEIDLKLSQGMIATLIGQTRESTSKNIKYLKNRGILSYKGLSYSVDKRKLERFLGEDSFTDLDLQS